ncbi:MAG TPA: DUF1015 domain-containing protein [Candidatus Absconditabacterales bacterium]|nr:DUF1015 domain-containing protein [Candidatus Absconditabacterales bacterium]
MKTFFESIGVKVPEIYLPNTDVDWNKRAVVACDQYTSQPDYWNEVKELVGNVPSTLNIIFPEIYLEDDDGDERIVNIKENMVKYMNEGVLENKGNGFIYIDRSTSQVRSRKGLIMALDLEQYDYSKGSQTLMRATEGTIVDRLPPRIKVRDGAPFELPHIMVLIDDPEKQVIEPIAEELDKHKKLYDFDLMMEGGHITGYQVTNEETVSRIVAGLEKLANKEVFKNKYNVGDDLGVLLFAMGDGNHSFATAKAIWEEKKKSLSLEEMQDHPARFALVEINNVHDAGITFEPIHRVLFNIDNDDLFNKMAEYFKYVGSELTVEHYSTKDELKENLKNSTTDIHYCRGMNQEGYMILGIKNPKLNLEVGNIQAFLDKYLAENTEAKIDYVHGEDATEELGRKKGNLGLLFPIMDKSDFFKTVVVDGALPRKTFSMGEAEEKRFYLECRKIVK